MTIPVVDFFAGPGGLGEGFSAFTNGSLAPFRIVLSVEKDPAAHATLKLRAFVRRFPRDRIPLAYYLHARGVAPQPWDDKSGAEWVAADKEALNATLGDPACDEELDRRLAELHLEDRPWVLIGGPPCQAFSLVGRARNSGVEDYKPEDDERHFLYKHYLRVLDQLAPPVFVFENVKGLLSSNVDGQEMFARILEDLSRPARALRGERARGVQYRIRGLSKSTLMSPGEDPNELDWRDFVVRSEKHGVPQARHRVILIGVRTDVDAKPRLIARAGTSPTVADVIGGLPRLRSGLSGSDDFDSWRKHVLEGARKARRSLNGSFHDLFGANASFHLDESEIPEVRSSLSRPIDLRLERHHSVLHAWYHDDLLDATLNHDARSHMASDLHRYIFCTLFANAAGRSPTARDFPEELAPAHESWGTGTFDDRFRVQVAGQIATTVTSHIAKDGHYFIHYDPSQCRSLTVREAARVQTFPDNYVFKGNRTQQYVQVGNAVPPLIASELARVVYGIMKAA